MKKMADIFIRRKLCLLVSGWHVALPTPLFVFACMPKYRDFERRLIVITAPRYQCYFAEINELPVSE